MVNGRFKFRAWEPINKEMHYMDFALVEGDRYASRADCVLRVRSMNLDALQVMQWTGLQDRNGEEIYEGDFLISQTVHLFEDADIVKRPCQVVWIEDRAGFYLGLDGKAVGLSEYLAGWKAAVFEIIGNIHENPELLK